MPVGVFLLDLLEHVQVFVVALLTLGDQFALIVSVGRLSVILEGQLSEHLNFDC